MPTDQPAWQHSAAAAEAKEANPSWRQGASTAVRAPLLPTRRAGLLLTWFLFLLFCGCLVWVATWVSPPKKVAVFLVGAGYEDNSVFPPNCAGQASLRELADLAKKPAAEAAHGNRLLRLAQERIHEVRTESAWDAGLDDFKESILLLVVSMHGATDTRGPYLLPANADARLLPFNRLRMETVLQRLERVPSSTKIVLVLDVVHMPAHWPLGMLHNDFARGMEALDEDIRKLPNLVVMLSSGADQLSWPSQNWGATIFGHFLVDGLRGGADLDGNHKIDALEMHRFLKSKVRDWTRRNRWADQEPVLLPRGAEGEQRAQAIVLNTVEHGYKPADPESLPDKTAFLPEIRAAWDDWARLRSAAPAPYVHTPHLWQRYQAAVLHYESALRFRDTETAKRKKDQLSTLGRAIAEARQVPLRSLDATLTMPALAGVQAKKLDAATEDFAKNFWEAKDDDEAKELLDQAKKKRWKETGVPVGELAARILARVQQEKIAALPHAAKRLKLLRQGDRPLPAEAHWVVMMQRDLPAGTRQDPEMAELFGLALEVRLLAERCAVSSTAYSEEVYPWIGTPLAQADQDRQSGQDRMLSSQKSDWRLARKSLLAARDSCRNILRQAGIVRQALTARDEAFAELPAYSHWLARRPAFTPAKPPVTDPKLDGAVKELWQDVHRLAQMLETPDAKLLNPTGPPAAVPLQAQTENITRRFKDLQDRFDRFVTSLLLAPHRTNDETRFVWLEGEAALVPPHRNVQERMDLLEQQRQLSRNLLVLSLLEPAPTLPDDITASVRRTAKREGDMALAWLGQTWFDRFGVQKIKNEESYVQVERRLEEAVVETRWHDTILKAGDQVGQRARRMPLEIQRLLTADAKAEKSSPRERVAAADRLAHCLEATLQLPEGLDPCREYRRLQLGDFLLAQVRRTFQDHWYDEIPSAEPYYCAVGRTFLADANALLPAGKSLWGPALKQTLSGWDKTLQNPVELMLRDVTEGQGGDAKAGVVTSEQQWDRAYRLVPMGESGAGEVPAGYPAVWVEDSASLRAVTPKALERVVVPLPFEPKKQDSGIASFRFTSPLVAEAETKDGAPPFHERTPLKMRGLYRGHVLRLETPVDLYAEPTTILRQIPLPEKASVAVRTGRDLTIRLGTNNSGVAFVLDCSGSMGSPDPADPKLGRYYQAVEALRLVLKKMPKDTVVSVLTFGSADDETGGTFKPERTIKHALEPTPWNPDDSVQLDNLITKLHALRPWNKSPLLRTLLFARDDLNSIRGNKTVVAITDGHDNRFDTDKELVDRFKTIPALLKAAFDGSGISLHMVLFPPVTEEEKQAQAQYDRIETFRPAGQIHKITDIAKLAALLENVMRQRLNYWVDRTGQNITVNEIPSSGLDVSTSDKNDRWIGKGLPPGGHKVRVNVPDPVEKAIVLHRGDLLLLDLVESPKGLIFERYLFSNDYPWKRRAENRDKDWRLAVLQNQLLDKNALEMLVTLEKTVDRRETVLEQIKPRDAWIEVDLPPGVSAEYSTRWSYLAAYPAPAWSIDVPRWPSFPGTTKPAAPVLNVWFNPDEEARSGAELQVLPLMKETYRPVIVKNEKNVLIESATFEEHRVEVERGVFAKRNCLVVRLRHDARRPILTRMAGAQIAGAEHRFYAKAGKYTGLYWFADDKTTIPPEARLRIISVASFKEEAERRGYFLAVRDLSSPEPTDFRPRPPLELK